MDINFHFLQPVTLRKRTVLRDFIKEIFKIEKVHAEYLNIIFCDDNFLLSINRKFLSHDYLTDIISFNLNLREIPVQGEIYISVERVKNNAKILNLKFNDELHRVVFHGILHFCRYDDKTEGEKSSMTNRENYYLERYFVPRGT